MFYPDMEWYIFWIWICLSCNPFSLSLRAQIILIHQHWIPHVIFSGQGIFFKANYMQKWENDYRISYIVHHPEAAAWLSSRRSISWKDKLPRYRKQGVETGVTLFTITLSCPLGEYVLPLSANLGFAGLGILVPRLDTQEEPHYS